MENSRKRIINSNYTNNPIVGLENKDLFKLLNSNNYPKGGWVLHMLRGYMGDKLFFDGIAKYYDQYKYKTVTTKDFQSVMEKVKGENLNWFFDQWVFKPGYPIFTYQEKWSSRKKSLLVTISQTQMNDWPFFIVPTEICWGEKNCKSIRIDKKKQSFEFKFNTRPQKIGMLDPQGWILKEISFKK